MTETATTPDEPRSDAKPLAPEDELGIPKPRRLMHTLTEADGTPCLYLYYGIKEICFDDARLIPFGRGLLDHPRFRADEACRWSEGEPYEWSEVRELLEVLLEEEILVPAAELPDPAATAPSNLPVTVEGEDADPSGAEVRATWSRHDDRCPHLTAEIFGRSQPSSHLEFLIPSYRVAHPAFDRDERQVGEANVYPPDLRARVPTEWRTCPYPGSRFQDERPMNISALRSMSEHWTRSLTHALQARGHFLRRVGIPADPDLHLGNLYLLSLFLLAIPGYMLHRPRDPVASGDLSVAIASLFRVTDGVRFSIEHFLHGHGREVLSLDAHLDPRAFLDLVEQECLFLGVHGVCAGPAPRVLEFLELMITGRWSGPRDRPHDRGSEGGSDRETDPSLHTEVGSLDAVLAYTVLTTWLTTAQELFWHRTATLARALGEAASQLEVRPDCPRPDVPRVLREVARSHRRSQTEPPRLRRPEVLEELLRQCARLAGTDAGTLFGQIAAPRTEPTWKELAQGSRLLPEDDERGDETAAALHRFLRERQIPSALPEGALEALVPAVLQGAALERRALGVFNTLQQLVNELLERPVMDRPLDRRDLVDQGRVLAGAIGEDDTPETASRRLVTEVAERLLGLEIELREDATVVRHGSAEVALPTETGS